MSVGSLWPRLKSIIRTTTGGRLLSLSAQYPLRPSRSARMAFASAAVVVPQASFYSVTNYSSVRVTNINRTTIVNNFHAAPVVNNTVIRNYNQSTAKYNFVNKAPDMKPHAPWPRGSTKTSGSQALRPRV